ncbi:hypothetical protein TPHA_0H01340 [Tetrapisispora phaffii CBS 4417]|uniref:Uncharacterized protein n=1 Tax=Tetrapisispora phaffii (strain ATCC 24235 / CBS 4417 / NBRC 1672 / NRRL Y-8282 / UCD 70-5) TaxID=1071381 RepID=G8BX37_TETPH|nr:hypothetical protein TPHA_0H01340 [Tetrapisispora phaffii CBS 4417]CCE64341.1 hypothetical protein TPHA_0H01340 [Tetrapisispora phaffii CBS 4417]
MQATNTPEKVAKRRGRPPITKHYANPLQSPMAHSSKQVQKQGLTGQNTSKPLMKVGSMTPSPKKRKRSQSITSNNSFTSASELNGSNSQSSSNLDYKSKRSNYRGVILITPQRQCISTPNKSKSEGNIASESALSTPNSTNSNIFSSTSRATALRSSPPTASPLIYHNKKSNLTNPISKIACFDTTSIPKSIKRPFSDFKLSFSINPDGRASIQGSKAQLTTPTSASDMAEKTKDVFEDPLLSNAYSINKNNSNNNDTNNNSNDIEGVVNKDHVLSLLRNLRNNKIVSNTNNVLTSTNRSNQKVTTATNLPVIIETSTSISSSPKVKKLTSPKQNDATNSLLPPTTPKSHFQFTTGFTPIGIDQILLDEAILDTPRKIFNSFDSKFQNITGSTSILLSPKAKLSTKTANIGSSSQELVFKLSSGDPLLLTDKYITNPSNTNTNINENPAQTHLLLATPSKKRHFNTPPSWINFGSPKTSDANSSNNILLPTQSNQLTMTDIKEESMTAIKDTTKIISSPKFNLLSSPRIDLSNLSQQFDFSFDTSQGNKRSILLTATPKRVDNTTSNQELQLSTVIECTPLIQQTMNGSLNSKILGTLNMDDIQHESGMQDCSVVPITSIAVEQDDARNALRKLMNNR